MIKIEIPNYLTRVKLSDTRRPAYFKPVDDLPLKYRDESRYIFKIKQKSGFCLYDTVEKTFVIRNSQSLDKPRFQSINGNDLFARTYEHVRDKIVHELEEHFMKHLDEVSIPQELYPLCIRMELQTQYGVADWDVDNLWVYHKCFIDSLRHKNILTEDNVLNIRDAGRTTFIPVREGETPKMTFYIEKASEITTPETNRPLYVVESPNGEPGEVEFCSTTATMFTGKKKIIFGAAKKAVRTVMLHALNNFETVFVTSDVYQRYQQFFDENTFNNHVKIIINDERRI